MAEIELQYEPRKLFLPFHQRENRWACMVCHRRAGKTVAAVNELVLRSLYTTKKNARYAYIAPFYRQAKDVAWTYLKEAVSEFVVTVRESALRVELPNGAWITLYGADNPDALRGIYLDGVVLDEYGDCRPSLWEEVILPTLADRKGWALFIGTPKGKNHFYKINQLSKQSDDWFHLTLKASLSNILDPEELASMEAQMTPERYQQELECSFTAAVMGTYYADMIEKLELNEQIRPGACDYDPNEKVHVAMDLGYTDSTATWFWQHRPDGIAVIDYEENSGKALPYYIDQLRDKPYEYERIWLPHDARAKTLQTGRSTIEQMLTAGLPCAIAPQLKKQQGIDAARLVLPHCYINTTSCSDGVEALRAYRRKYDEINKCFSNEPLHDWSSHGADAFRYFALVCQTAVKLPAPTPLTNPYKPDGYTLEQLYAEREHHKPKFERLRM